MFNIKKCVLILFLTGKAGRSVGEYIALEQITVNVNHENFVNSKTFFETINKYSF